MDGRARVAPIHGATPPFSGKSLQCAAPGRPENSPGGAEWGMDSLPAIPLHQREPTLKSTISTVRRMTMMSKTMLWFFT